MFETRDIKSSDAKIKKFKKNFTENIKKNSEVLKNNIKNQAKFNEIISKIISRMNIGEKESYEDISDQEKEKESLKDN